MFFFYYLFFFCLIKEQWSSSSAISLSHLIESEYMKSNRDIPLPNDITDEIDNLNNRNNEQYEDPSISSLSRLFPSQTNLNINPNNNTNNNKTNRNVTGSVTLMTPSRDDDDIATNNNNNKSNLLNPNNRTNNKGSKMKRAGYNSTSSVEIPPFFVLLWENGAPSIELYLISTQTPKILTCCAKLCVYHNGKSSHATPFAVCNSFFFIFLSFCKIKRF